MDTYYQIRPCVDAEGHIFTHNEIASGNYGPIFTYCTRCGRKATELRPRS